MYRIRCEEILPNFSSLKKRVEKELPTNSLGAHAIYVTHEFKQINIKYKLSLLRIAIDYKLY